jgi:hypothetical protein
VAGMSPTKIGEQIWVTRQHVYRLLAKAVQELDVQDAERARELRVIQSARIDERFVDLMPQAREGDRGADRALVRYFDREARLNGLDLERRTEDEGPAEIG